MLADSKYAVTTKTANYTATGADSVILVDATAGNVTVTLPVSVIQNQGQAIIVKKTDTSSNTVALAAASGDTLESAVTLYAQYQTIMAVCTGAGSWTYPHGTPLNPAFLGAQGDPNGAATLTASSAYLLGVNVPNHCAVASIGMAVGTSSGNVDVGIYDASGTRIASSGSTACPAAGVRKVNLSATANLKPGSYYLALAADNGTATFTRNGTNMLIGSRVIATSFPLPSTLTLPGTATITLPALVGYVVGGIAQ